MRYGSFISVDIDVDDILPELSKKEVAEYFHLGAYDDSTPIGLLQHLKTILAGGRPMLPQDVKTMISEWIDDNLYNSI